MAGTDVIVHADKTQYIHGVGAGTIVGTATTQTLTNKTIVGGTITGAVLTNCTGIDVSLDGKTGTGMTIVSSTLSGTTTNAGTILNSGTILNGTISGATLTGCTVNGYITSINGLTGTGMTISGSTMTGTITGSGATYLGGTISGVTLTGTVTGSGLTLLGGTLTGSILANPTMSLASSTNGDMWYQASGVVSRLAKGTKNQYLRMNTAATTPEWGSVSNYVYVQRDLTAASGDVSYTGAGFKPRGMVAFAISPAAQSWGLSFGADSKMNMMIYGTTLALDSSASYFIKTWSSSGNYQTALVKTADDDGFTLTWTKTGSPTGTCYCWVHVTA